MAEAPRPVRLALVVEVAETVRSRAGRWARLPERIGFSARRAKRHVFSLPALFMLCSLRDAATRGGKARQAWKQGRSGSPCSGARSTKLTRIRNFPGWRQR